MPHIALAITGTQRKISTGTVLSFCQKTTDWLIDEIFLAIKILPLKSARGYLGKPLMSANKQIV
jgi:hypothetical protein